LTEFRFSTSIRVRYSDLDAQGHVNSARYFTFMEEARLHYAQALGLWTALQDFMGVGQIVAEATCTYLRPVFLGQTVEVAVRIARMGTKSMTTEYRLTVGAEEVATGRTVQVTYDFKNQRSLPIPDTWRQRIEAYESGVG
jgi:acyl-CoA thioester hydrolase